ncbi:MAG: hypothetical protein ACOC1O_01875 [bacterium]
MRIIEGKLYRLLDKEPIVSEFRNKIVKIVKIREDIMDYNLTIEFVGNKERLNCKEEYLKPIKNNIIKI